jgi:HemX protein
VTGAALRLATVALPALYLALALSASRSADGSERRGRRALGVLAVLLHGAFFALVHRETGVFPLTLPGAILSALALALVLVYAWVEWTSGVTALSGAVLGTVFVVQCAATAVGFAPAGQAPAPTAIWMTHVVTIVASVATLFLSGFFGVIYLVTENEMRSQRFGPLFARLPKLSELASMMRLAATAGFVLMTVGYNLGIWQAHASSRAGFSYLDPMVVITMATWIVFGLIALSRWVRFLSGRKAAVTAILGIVLLVLTIVVSVVPNVSFHRLF